MEETKSNEAPIQEPMETPSSVKTPSKEEPIEHPTSVVKEEELENSTPIEPPKKKPKRQLSEKQLEALKNGRERRMQQIKEGTYRKRKKPEMEIEIPEEEPMP
mmetsp:Transcript_21770/g.28533  ORF Transcript_21770/g.28533 Transcript_21770/m.28533 type:complete len:103 (+) Transcript_21770:48-356(+)